MESKNLDNYFHKYIDSHDNALKNTEVILKNSKRVVNDEGINYLVDLSNQIKSVNGCQHFIGNGASMAFANHMALDWTKNGKVLSQSYTNPSLITAISNDISFSDFFSLNIQWFGNPNDLLVTISTSGNSENIINAIETAKNKSMKIVTFSGLDSNNRSRNMGDINFYVPAKTYGIVECAHQVLLHLWLDKYMNVNEWDRHTIQNMNSKNYQL